MKVVILSVFVIQMLFVGCSTFKQTTLSPIKNSKYEIKEEATQKNKELTANIGEQVYTYNKYELSTFQVYKNNKEILYPKPYMDVWTGISYDQTKLLEVSKDSLVSFKKIYLSDLNNNENWILCDSINHGLGTVQHLGLTYFVIENDSLNRISYPMINRNHAFIPPIPVQKYELETKGKNLFSFELIYLGIQNNSIVLSYREYTEDMLRSNFSQSVYYNVSEIKDNVIQYKNVKIKIIDYNNQNIKYMVID